MFESVDNFQSANKDAGWHIELDMENQALQQKIEILTEDLVEERRANAHALRLEAKQPECRIETKTAAVEGYTRVQELENANAELRAEMESVRKCCDNDMIRRADVAIMMEDAQKSLTRANSQAEEVRTANLELKKTFDAIEQAVLQMRNAGIEAGAGPLIDDLLEKTGLHPFAKGEGNVFGRLYNDALARFDRLENYRIDILAAQSEALGKVLAARGIAVVDPFPHRTPLQRPICREESPDEVSCATTRCSNEDLGSVFRLVPANAVTTEAWRRDRLKHPIDRKVAQLKRQGRFALLADASITC